MTNYNEKITHTHTHTHTHTINGIKSIFNKVVS